MSIEILSPRLANQIAAGEVVERPASVVKELVENSIDAGASDISIEIELGGAKLVKVRDNGSGVAKEQLTLALSRHATSKISTLDDLEAIVSLGFRGEALASISSVCRLTFTSKTQQQSEAWQAYAQGRDMAVEIIPASHPVGTTVSVVDLFFNTPARRRFLRTEKTEFSHIDELFKRFALSHFEIKFLIKHNGKILQNLQIATTQAQRERRVAALCGKNFIEHAIAITNEHHEIKLSGWLALPQGCKSHNDVQYCYVNGRMMRDKLINHAIRQAYQDWLPEGLVPSYIIYIEMPANQVDVNVHPAKHEVRFHQSRMVHDLIFTVLNSGLSQALSQSAQSVSAVASHDYGQHSSIDEVQSHQGDYQSTGSGSGISRGGSGNYTPTKPIVNLEQAALSYQSLLSTPGLSAITGVANNTEFSETELFGQPLSVINDNFLLIKRQNIIELLSLHRLATLVNQSEYQTQWPQGFRGQPLLLPVAIKVDRVLIEQIEHHQQLFRRLGIELSVRSPQIIVKQVPSMLRQQDIAMVIPQLLQLLMQQSHLSASDHELREVICGWLAGFNQDAFSMAQASNLLARAESHHDFLLNNLKNMIKSVDFSKIIDNFTQ